MEYGIVGVYAFSIHGPSEVRAGSLLVAILSIICVKCTDRLNYS
jgi:hypothetical protein